MHEIRAHPANTERWAILDESATSSLIEVGELIWKPRFGETVLLGCSPKVSIQENDTIIAPLTGSTTQVGAQPFGSPG